MSDNRNENALRIAAYLENRLSPEEREAFKRALADDDELRVQYVDALMNKAAPGPNAGGTGAPVAGAVEPAAMAEPAEGAAEKGELEENAREAGVGEREDVVEERGAGESHEEREAGESREEHEAGFGEEHEQHANWGTPVEQGPTEAWEAGWPGGKKRARGGFLGSGWMVGAAVLLLAIAGVVMYLMTSHEGFWDRTIAAQQADTAGANKGNGMDSVRTASGAGTGAAGGGTSAAPAAVAAGKPVLADSTYARLYKPYMRGDDPVEVREYYQDYRTGNYTAVLAAGDSAVMKIPARRLVVRDYMRLYIGLSYLATGDGQNSVRELGGVAIRTKPGDVLYEAARWYLALAWLKREDVDPAEARGKAMGLARDISHSYSRYSESARELIRVLKS